MQVYSVGYVLLIRKKEETKSTPSHMEVTENATSHFQGDRILSLLLSFFLHVPVIQIESLVRSRYSSMSRGTEAAGTVSLNKFSSVGILESRSLSDTNSKCSLPAGFHCQPQSLFQELCCFLSGSTQLSSFSKILLRGLNF